jgi:septal ring factor EnvC (AmiA/AmiB activator)
VQPGKLFSILVLFAAGCLSPVTKRLDTTNEQLALTNQHLAAINAQMREANARMLDMNQHLQTTNAQLRETNRRLEAIEKGLPRLPRLGAGDPSVLPQEKRLEVVE